MFATLARWVKPTRPVDAGSDGSRAPLPELPGIDTIGGLANVVGNEVLYRRMLAMFRDREADFEQRLRAALAAGDVAAATRAAHDLKSEAGTLGMVAVGQAATALEQAIKDHAAEADIDALVGTVVVRLEPVIAGLRALDATRASRP